VSDGEIVARVERRRKWTAEEKAALLAEVEAEGGKVRLVARRHRIAESLLYNWRSTGKMAAAGSPGAVEFTPLGVFHGVGKTDLTLRRLLDPARTRQPASSDGRAGVIAIALPNGSRISVDAGVDEQALSRVLRAMKGVT
jgi:transposase